MFIGIPFSTHNTQLRTSQRYAIVHSALLLLHNLRTCYDHGGNMMPSFCLKVLCWSGSSGQWRAEYQLVYSHLLTVLVLERSSISMSGNHDSEAISDVAEKWERAPTRRAVPLTFKFVPKSCARKAYRQDRDRTGKMCSARAKAYGTTL